MCWCYISYLVVWTHFGQLIKSYANRQEALIVNFPILRLKTPGGVFVCKCIQHFILQKTNCRSCSTVFFMSCSYNLGFILVVHRGELYTRFFLRWCLVAAFVLCYFSRSSIFWEMHILALMTRYNSHVCVQSTELMSGCG